jgi:O-antigen ligase
LGIEFFAPVALACWLLGKRLLLSLRLRIPFHAWVMLALLVWQLAHVGTVVPGELDLFIKAQGTFLALFCLFVAMYNIALDEKKWSKVLGAIEGLGYISLFFGMVFILGIWEGQFISVLGRILPQNLIAQSHFFESISVRDLGLLESATGFRRVRSIFWHPNGYAAALLILFAIVWYRLKDVSGVAKLFAYGAIALILLNIFFTFSRTTYVVWLMMLLIGWWLQGPHTYQSRLQKLVIVTAIIVLGLFYLSITFLLPSIPLFEPVYRFIFEIRPFSLTTRLQIYEISWQLVQEKPFWGWSTLVRIEGLPSFFSAGSHNDYLSMVFQYGIPGLLMYLFFIAAVWWTLIRGYFMTYQNDTRRFFAIMISLMVAINLRQLTSGLMWDMYIASMIWGIWSVSLAKYTLAKEADNRLAE